MPGYFVHNTTLSYNPIIFPSKVFHSTLVSFISHDFIINNAFFTMFSEMDWNAKVILAFSSNQVFGIIGMKTCS